MVVFKDFKELKDSGQVAHVLAEISLAQMDLTLLFEKMAGGTG